MKEIIKKELESDLLTPKGFIWFILSSILLSILSYLFLINRELSLLDQSTMVFYLMEAILILGILRTIVYGSDSYAGEIERGTMEVLLIVPVKKSSIAYGKLVSALINWFILFMISIPYLLVVGFRGQNIYSSIAYLFFFGTLTIIFFSSISMILSIKLKVVKNAIMLGTLLFFLLATTIILPASLKESWIGRSFDIVNPIAAAVNTFDSVVIDSESFSLQLRRLFVLIFYSIFFLMILTEASDNEELIGAVE